MNISHKGIGTGRGLPFSLAAGLSVAPGQQANFPHYNKLAMRTTVQGECKLTAVVGDLAIGVLVDCSSKGDSVTVETAGFEWVVCDDTVAVGDLVTVCPDDEGELDLLSGVAPITAFADPAAPTAGEAATFAKEMAARELARISGIWQVDAIRTVAGVKQALIDLDDRR
jgi:hypothetical protein